MNSSYQIITNPQQQGAITTAADVQTLTDQFIAFVDAAPQSLQTYKTSIKKLTGYLAENNITAPTRADILQYRDYLKAHYKATTVSLHITAARLFFRWTAQNGLYPNIADHIKGAKLDRNHKKDYLTSKQVKAVMRTATGATITQRRDYAILLVMLVGGLRCIEVVRANIEDISTAGDSAALYIQGKGREEKTEYMKLPALIENAIRDYLNARGETDGRAPLFASESNNSNGGRLTRQSISRLVKQHLRAAGFNSDRLTAHSLRHTCATLNLLNGATIEETQQLLRHKNINTTMIYSHSLERAKNNSENRIAAAIF